MHDFLFDVKTLNGTDHFMRVCSCGLTYILLAPETVDAHWNKVADDLDHTHDDAPASLVDVKSAMGFHYQDDDDEEVARMGFRKHGKSK